MYMNDMTSFLDSLPQADIFYSKYDVPIPGISTRDCLWLRMTIQPDCMPDQMCGEFGYFMIDLLFLLFILVRLKSDYYS